MTKKIILFILILVILSFCSFTCAEEQTEPAKSDLVINEADGTFHNDGKTVFNNMGTVYNNAGTVYNNGGTVYNNDGVTYNNGGTVYLNGGEVYNNGGEVFVNGDKGVLYETKNAEMPTGVTEKATEPEENFGYEITLGGDYSPFADITGLTERDGKLYLAPDGQAHITVKPGVTLLSSYADSGSCTMLSDGVIVLGDVRSDAALTLKFKLDDPIVAPDFGAYAEAQQVRLIAAECARVYYTLDGSQPDENSTLYTEPFELDTSCTLSAAAFAEGAEKGKTTGSFIFPQITGPVFKTVNAGYSPVEPQPIVIENTGIDKLRIVSAELTGTAAKSFVLTGEAGGRVLPGMTDSKTWTVAPADGLKAGIYYASVELKFAEGGSAEVPLVFTVR